MPGKAFLVALLTIAAVAGMGRLLAVNNPGGFSWLTEPRKTGWPAPTSEAPANTEPPGAGAIGSAEPSADALGYMLVSVAERYEQSIRYPEYSLPLSPEQAIAYQGNRYEPVELPLEGNGVFTVTLEKYRYTQQEDILVAASLTGAQVIGSRLEAHLESTETRTKADSASLTSSDEPGYFEGKLQAYGEPGEYRLIVEATVDGRPIRHASTLTIEPDLGEFEGLGDIRVRGNDLVIPVVFQPENGGYFALSAQLFSNGKPLAQLLGERQLDGAGGSIELRAHGSVLADQNISGEFHLKHLQIRRLPARPGDRTDHAFGPEEGYSFTPPDLDGLTNTPAGNPESEQRAALLRQLADKF